MKILPGMAAPAQQQSVFAPLISGFSSAATNLASIDWSSGVGTGKQPGGGGTSGTSWNTQADFGINYNFNNNFPQFKY